MAAKAVSARKRFNRNGAFAGMARSYKNVAHPTAGGASTAPVGAAHGRESGERKETLNRNRRFRGHGPLLQERGPFRGWRIHRPCRSGPWPRKR
jgi:hypothetical protein